MRPSAALGYLVVMVVSLLASTLSARAQTQHEMTQQAYADFEKSDKELNAVYQQVLKAMADDIARQKLIAAQKAWVKFRDAEAEFEADSFRGGTAESQLNAINLTDTTDARIAALKKYLADEQTK